MTVKQISVFLENRPGALAEFTRILEKSNMNLRALSLAESEDFGIVRVIVDDPFETIRILKDEGSSAPSPRSSQWRSRTNPAHWSGCSTSWETTRST